MQVTCLGFETSNVSITLLFHIFRSISDAVPCPKVLVVERYFGFGQQTSSSCSLLCPIGTQVYEMNMHKPVYFYFYWNMIRIFYTSDTMSEAGQMIWHRILLINLVKRYGPHVHFVYPSPYQKQQCTMSSVVYSIKGSKVFKSGSFVC